VVKPDAKPANTMSGINPNTWEVFISGPSIMMIVTMVTKATIARCGVKMSDPVTKLIQLSRRGVEGNKALVLFPRFHRSRQVDEDHEGTRSRLSYDHSIRCFYTRRLAPSSVWVEHEGFQRVIAPDTK
jgi:hypothetical protein